ncbi:armadillo-type protein [Haematococcus lacustris]
MSTTTAPSSKQEKPTLAGVTVKTRKRNIVVPVDPGSFADAVVQIVQDASDGQSVAEDLEAAGKALDAAEIEYSRYGDTLFEVLFAGGRLANGAALAEGGARLPFNILGSPAERDAIAPYIKLFQNLTRRRPFLVRGIENTMVKLLLSLEFFNAENRKKIALALALIFSMKIAVLPDNIFGAMLNDRLVAKGTVQEVFTIFCQTFLAKDSMDDLVSILTKAKVANQLLDYMPPQKRSLQDFNEHFKSAGLEALVEWNMKRDQEIKISELQEALSNMITAEEPASPAEVLSMVKSKKTENNLPESEVLRVVWTSLMKAVNMGGKNQQQIMQAIVAKIKTYHKLLSTFATNGKLELGLLLVVQVQCYEDNRLLKLFSDIVRVLYDADIVGEDAIFHWYKKGSHPKGRNVFTKDIEPFIKWLEEAEEEAD